MPDTPLNPDALEAVARERYESRRSFEDLPAWEDLLERNRKAEIRALGNIVSAYLAVAQPEVNIVEELDALPCASVVLNGVTAFQKYGAREPFDWSADGRWYDSTQVELPARVLYIPEVNDGR